MALIFLCMINDIFLSEFFQRFLKIYQLCLGLLKRYFSCSFQNRSSRKGTSRITLSGLLDLVNCYTIETSYYSFLDQDRNTVEFNSLMLHFLVILRREVRF